MKNLIQAAVVTLSTASTVQAQQAVQWKVSDGGNGHWYQATSIRFRNFAAAQTFAVQAGGHLVTLTSEGENGFVSAMATGEFLLGGFQDLSSQGYSEPSGGWKWVTGEPWQFTRWRAGEPNNNGQIDANAASEQYLLWWRFGLPANDEWNDGFNDATAEFSWDIRAIIEWSADCNADGIVDYGQCRDGSLPDYNGNNIPDCCEAGAPCVVGNYPIQWRTAEGGNGHWYQRSEEFPSWTAAQSASVQRGGHLATITSAQENAVASLVNGELACFLGGTQAPGACEPDCGWTWVTGEPWGFAHWATGQPDDYTGGGGGPENRLYYFYGSRWNDGNGVDASRAVIEWSADCNNDGIVDKGQILRGQLQDANADGVPDVCQQPTCRDADLLADRNINGIDLGILLGQWGPNTQYTVSDINQDGWVDGVDLGMLLGFWGPCPY